MTAAETRIHDAALRIFAEKGVTQLTVSELAEEAGVARGTVYNNLGSTDALFEEVAAGLRGRDAPKGRQQLLRNNPRPRAPACQRDPVLRPPRA